jgi:hypothetical protein
MKDQLLKVREIVAAHPVAQNAEGCLEDAICKVLYGVSWWENEALNSGERGPAEGYHNVKAEPIYGFLLARIPRSYTSSALWYFNDQCGQPAVLALLDKAIAEVGE